MIGSTVASDVPLEQIQQSAQRQTRFTTIDRMADDYDISRTVIHKLIREGSIDARKLGRRTLVDVASIESFFASLPSARGPG